MPGLSRNGTFARFMIADPVTLREFTSRVFRHIGCSDAHADLAADVLLKADLRGIDSHGVARLSGYIRLWEKQRINTDPHFVLEHETFTTATLNADRALGLVSAGTGHRLRHRQSRVESA